MEGKTYLGESTKDLRGQEGQKRGLEEHGDENGERTVRTERRGRGMKRGRRKVVRWGRRSWFLGGGDNLASASNGGDDTKQG